ncbi:HAD-IIIC family phosphatase [Streptomyces sp. NBC_00647]|uniref:HAD-IIIC family phosphatase n=1 Tax=Streptomyces sp. NBC_00647 TaxID=2975796 RepID=UPI0032540FC6
MVTSRPDALNELLALQRNGTLLAEFPRIGPMLDTLDDHGRATAGRRLAALDPAALLSAHPGLAALTVAVTGHGTLAELVPALTTEFARAGIVVRPVVSDFDSWVFDLADPESGLYAASPDLVLCLLDHAVVLDALPSPWDVDDVARALEEKVRAVEGLTARFTERSKAVLVLNTLPLPGSFAALTTDQSARARLARLWYEANARLLALPELYPSVVVVDLGALTAEGVAVEDARLRAYAHANLSPALLGRYARQIGPVARRLTGRSKKVLALDLDGTLWGGVLGEDGPEGIELGDGYRGAAFQDFQRVVRQLGSQGVLLAIVSKNDPEAVREVLRGHPGMVLKEEDFVSVAASWRPKHESLRELAQTLNLGTDSFVFVDDNPYECGLVRHELPEVAVVQLDEEPARHAGRLLADGHFDVAGLTADDRARPARYRQEVERRTFLESFDSLDGYLRELDTRVRLAPAESGDITRVSQLTLRTNQFNLTTVRLQPAAVGDLLADPSALVLTISAADRFGDHGLIGAVLLRREGDRLDIGNFLLSCRVFSRGIEQACLAAVLRAARADGVREVTGSHRLTAKNGKVRDFLERGGFEVVGRDETETAFRHDLAELLAPPPHITLDDRAGTGPASTAHEENTL